MSKRSDDALPIVAAAFVGAFLIHKLLIMREKVCKLEKRRSELSLELMGTRNRLMHSPRSVENGLLFKPRPEDIFVVTYPKCGTTWMTQICHILRTRGKADLNTFGEITEVVPWDILAGDCGQDLDAEQVASPRIFKSHESFKTVPKGAKYIYVARNPSDAFVSFYKFLPPYMGLVGDDITMDDFSLAIFAGVSNSGQIWHHFLGWWKGGLENPDVLWCFYEDLVRDLEKEVRRVAAFMDIALDDELLEIVLERSSFEFMQQRSTQFDDHFVFDATKTQMGRAAEDKVTVGKVRKGGGKVGSRKTIPPSISTSLDEKWKDILAAPTGCADYAQLRAAVVSRGTT